MHISWPPDAGAHRIPVQSCRACCTCTRQAPRKHLPSSSSGHCAPVHGCIPATQPTLQGQGMKQRSRECACALGAPHPAPGPAAARRARRRGAPATSCAAAASACPAHGTPSRRPRKCRAAAISRRPCWSKSAIALSAQFVTVRVETPTGPPKSNEASCSESW
jgi:hypothetical protein